MLQISTESIEVFARENNIKLSLMEMKSKSLLNRNNAGMFKFAHKSIFEFFIANYLLTDRKSYESFSFSGLDQAKIFYDEMAFRQKSEKYFLKLLQTHRDNQIGLAAVQTQMEASLRTASMPENFKIDGLSAPVRSTPTAWFKNATKIKINGFDIDSINAFEAITYLQSLNLSNNKIRTIDYLYMPYLEHLDLSNNDLSAIHNLNLPSIKTINIDNNNLCDISAFFELKTLQELRIMHNPEISPIQIALLRRKTHCTIIFKENSDNRPDLGGGYPTHFGWPFW